MSTEIRPFNNSDNNLPQKGEEVYFIALERGNIAHLYKAEIILFTAESGIPFVRILEHKTLVQESGYEIRPYKQGEEVLLAGARIIRKLDQPSKRWN